MKLSRKNYQRNAEGPDAAIGTGAHGASNESVLDTNGLAFRDGSYLLSRRGLLIGLAGTGALVVGGYLQRNTIVQALIPLVEETGIPTGNADGGGALGRPDMWFEVPLKGPIVLFSPKVEIGQGIHTTLTQIALEELGVKPDQLVLRDVPTTRSPIFPVDSRGFGNLLSTAASQSTQSVFGPLRQSAATLREMLLLEGARQLNSVRNEVESVDGVVRIIADPTRMLTYGAVVAGRSDQLGNWKPPTKPVKLKSSKEFTVIGTDFPRVDAVAKVTGAAVYGFDARLPDAVFGAVVHPPRYGAKLAVAKSSTADSMPGVLKVVIDTQANFVGVVAKTRGQAERAAAKLELQWNGGFTDDTAALLSLVAKVSPVPVREKGDAEQALRKANSVIEATYATPFAAHAHLEPVSALASVTKDHCEVWVCTQSAEPVADEVGQALKEARVVTVHPTYVGGGFGRKFSIHAAAEAARLSEAVGKPVHVGWTREQDMAFGPFRPPSSASFRGSVNAEGKIVAIDQHTKSLAMTGLPEFAISLIGFDPSAMQGQFLPYEFDNYRVKSGAVASPVPTGIWRGVGLLPNVFGVESFMDELAHSANIDPLEFRLRHLPSDDGGQRFRRVLSEVAKRSGWGKPLGAGVGRGIACSGSTGATVATVVRVRVDGTGKDSLATVEQVHVCADPGLVVNPAGAKLQLVGAVMMSLSSAFHESATFKNGMAEQSNFDTYTILGPQGAPPVDVHLMGTGDVPGGLGEPGVGPVAAALANAIFAASNARLRSLPLRFT
jgi:isoquinoline 1-oxidoreductase subunit beta